MDEEDLIELNEDHSSEEIPNEGQNNNANEDFAPELQNDQNDSLENTCSICFEPWTTVGSHRICALRCGHMFGRSCIERWLKIRLKKQTTCPQCNRKALRSDITNLYLTKFSAIDTSLLEEIKKELDHERSLKHKHEITIYNLNLKINVLMTELQLIKKQNKKFKKLIHDRGSIQISKNSYEPINYQEIQKINVCKHEGCRILCPHPTANLLLVSKISENPVLFPGYGICKLSFDCIETEGHTIEFVRLHQQQIRDLVISKHDHSQLISSSLDKTIRITNLHNNSPIITYQAPCPIWSCFYDSENPALVYAGLANGSVLVYDIRNTEEILQTVSLKDGSSRPFGCPIVSIRPTIIPSSYSNIEGLLFATFNGLFFAERHKLEEGADLVYFPDGQLTYMSVDEMSNQILLSQRPKAGGLLKKCSHQVGNLIQLLDSNDTNCSKFAFSVLSSFEGGVSCTLMGRSSIFSVNETETRIAFSNEDDNSICVHGTFGNNSGVFHSKNGCFVDFAPIWRNQHYLIGLSKSSCIFYKSEV